jgi:hypothetical protein
MASNSASIASSVGFKASWTGRLIWNSAGVKVDQLVQGAGIALQRLLHEFVEHCLDAAHPDFASGRANRDFGKEQFAGDRLEPFGGFGAAPGIT